jgi:Flp pilus assembly protein TadG
MVEGALIMLPMLAIFLGIVDVCWGVFAQTTLTNATREGARFAVTYTSSYNGTSCSTSQATCIASAVQYYIIGLPNGLASSYITVNYYTANDLTNPAESCSAGTCTVNPNNASTAKLPQTLSSGIVVNYANQSGNIVEVVVNNYPWNWLIPLPNAWPSKGINLSARAVDVLGALPAGTNTPPNP